MKNYYIINDFVRFCPVENKFERLDGEGDAVIINSPASRCFLMLLKQQGDVISQQTFMDEVWQKKGVFVAPNTYYQNISILRKGLKSIGLGSNLVVTVPRIGLTLAKSINIKVVSPEEVADRASAAEIILPEVKTAPVVTLAEEESLTPAQPQDVAKRPDEFQRHKPASGAAEQRPPQWRTPTGSFLTFPFFSLNGHTLLKYNALLLFALVVLLSSGRILQNNFNAQGSNAENEQKAECSISSAQDES